jgi:hypothetical protein
MRICLAVHPDSNWTAAPCHLIGEFSLVRRPPYLAMTVALTINAEDKREHAEEHGIVCLHLDWPRGAGGCVAPPRTDASVSRLRRRTHALAARVV